jgi:hypothetical protein
MTPCPGIEFSIQVTGTIPDPSSFTLGDFQPQDVTLGPGTFTVTETPVSGFTPLTFLGRDCAPTGTGTISAGQTNLFYPKHQVRIIYYHKQVP